MFLDVYIGQLEDPYIVSDGGSIPKELSKLFPMPDGDYSSIDPFFRVLALANSGELPAEETFWQCTVVTVTRDQLLNYLDEWYGDTPIYPKPWTTRGEDPNKYEIRSLVRGLDPGQKYALVALEC